MVAKNKTAGEQKWMQTMQNREYLKILPFKCFTRKKLTHTLANCKNRQYCVCVNIL